MRLWRLWFPLACALAWPLGGCTPHYITRCPALISYSPEFNAALADELDAAGRPPHIEAAIGDYIAIRDSCKAAAR